MQPSRTEVWGELAALDPAPKLQRAAPPQLRPYAAARELTIEKHRDLQTLSEKVAKQKRLRAGCAARSWVKVHDRGYVDCADVRVLAAAVRDVDAVHSELEAREQRLRKLPSLAGEREDGAVMVRVSVEVKQPCASGLERLANRFDDADVTALRDVGDG